MAYDPQRDHPRHRPDDHEPSPVDPLLDGVDEPAADFGEPPPAPRATPEPAKPWSDRLLYATGISTVLATATGLVVLRWLWKRWTRRTRPGR